MAMLIWYVYGICQTDLTGSDIRLRQNVGCALLYQGEISTYDKDILLLVRVQMIDAYSLTDQLAFPDLCKNGSVYLEPIVDSRLGYSTKASLCDMYNMTLEDLRIEHSCLCDKSPKISTMSIQ